MSRQLNTKKFFGVLFIAMNMPSGNALPKRPDTTSMPSVVSQPPVKVPISRFGSLRSYTWKTDSLLIWSVHTK